jgi:hypothetical protein
MNLETGSASTLSDIEQHLRELVEKHTVRYEVNLLQDLMGDRVVDAGFEIDLLASHDHGSTRFTPGCSLCVSTFQDLREIATWILPKERRDSEYIIDGFDNGLHMTPRHRMHPEVLLALRIEHRVNKRQPIDNCERRCLDEMEAALRKLGVPKSRGPGRG